MTATIDTYTPLVMRGRPMAAQLVVKTIEPLPGEWYSRFREEGYQAPEVQIATTDIAATVSAANTLEANYKALIGLAVTIVDGFGDSHAECMIVNVQTARRLVIYEGTQQYQIDAIWTVRKASAA